MIAPNVAAPHPGWAQGHSRYRRARTQRTLVDMDMNAPPLAPPPPPPPPPPPFRPGHRLRRDRANGILGGVCAGVAETYDLDVTLVRVLWVIAGILWIGVPAYIVAWIVIPETDAPVEWRGRRRDPATFLGLVLVGIGVIVASNHLVPAGLRFNRFGAPLVLIGGGVAILLLRGRPDEPRDEDDEPPEVTDFASTRSPDEAPDEATESTEVLPPAVPPTAWTQTATWPAPPSRRERRRTYRRARPRSFLTPVTLSVLLIGAGIASLLQATGALDVNLTVVLAIGTCVVGAALVTAAFVGRAHTLILVGIVLLAATGISNTLDVPLRGGVGTRSYRPLRLSELQTHYELGIGELKVDLRDAPLVGRDTTIDAETGVGHLLVLVPSTVRVEVHSHAGAGSSRIFGLQEGGWPEDNERAVGGSRAGVLRLNLRVGAGQVEVRRYEPRGFETIIGGN